jgi:hypothetical protein
MSAVISALNSHPRPPMKEATLTVADNVAPVTATPTVLAVTAVGVAFGIGLLIGAAVR